MANLNAYLKLMVEKGASDLYFTTGAPVNIKVEGVTAPIGAAPLPSGEVRRLAYSVMNDNQVRAFEQEWELDLGVSAKDIGRFRVNVFRQRGEVAMVVRYLQATIPTIEQLHLPSVLRHLVCEPRGLILVVGATGSGKSTTLASMIDYRNRTMTGHILTIEDPIEYLHQHVKSVVNQREIGVDTKSYAAALKRAMREAPDVILIGEIRDQETMEQALSYAETGHLCLSTLHATNANQTLERIVSFFPDDARERLFVDLSLNLRAIVSQRLVTGVDGKRVPAVELLLSTPFVQELIHKGDIRGIRDALEHGAANGMQSFDEALFKLYKAGTISAQQALRHAESHANLSLRIRLDEGAGTSTGAGLSVADGERGSAKQ